MSSVPLAKAVYGLNFFRDALTGGPLGRSVLRPTSGEKINERGLSGPILAP